MMEEDELVEMRYTLENELTQYQSCTKYFDILNQYYGEDKDQCPFPNFINVLQRVLNEQGNSNVIAAVQKRIG